MIEHVQPEGFEAAPVVLVESNASTNDEAIREIDSWAREHGFVRSRERVLNVKKSETGQTIYYCACYPLREDALDIARTANDAMNARRNAMPLTASSADLISAER